MRSVCVIGGELFSDANPHLSDTGIGFEIELLILDGKRRNDYGYVSTQWLASARLQVSVNTFSMKFNYHVKGVSRFP